MGDYELAIAAVNKCIINFDYNREVDSKLTDEELRLISAMTRLSTMIMPTYHSKIGEVMYAANNPDVQLRVDDHGVDIINGDQSGIEHKLSICKRPGGRVNFNWHFTKHHVDENVRRQDILGRIRDNLKGGCAVLEIHYSWLRPHSIQTQIYMVTEAFLILFFTHLRLNANLTTYNMGCTHCIMCDTFHRLDNIQTASDKLACGDILSKRDIKLCYITVPCKRKTPKQ